MIVKNYELEERRKKLNYTQIEFAEIVGLTLKVYSEIESLKRKPTEEEAISIALEMGATKDTLFPQGYEKIVDVFNVSFDRVADFTPPLLAEDHERFLEIADAKMTVDRIIKDLPEKERKVLDMRYKQEKTLEETARSMGVTRERIRQIEAKAHERLRVELKDYE